MWTISPRRWTGDPVAFPRVGRRVGSWLALGSMTLAGSAVAVASGVEPAAAACAAKSKPDVVSAAALARTCKKSVSVSGATTATATLAANSDGSFTTTESIVPERVRRADGSWVPVDLTLQVNGDGTVSPVASPSAVVLSGGGTGPLVKTASQGQELVWTWT